MTDDEVILIVKRRRWMRGHTPILPPRRTVYSDVTLRIPPGLLDYCTAVLDWHAAQARRRQYLILMGASQ